MTIPEIKNLADKTPVALVQGKLTFIQQRRIFSGKSVQNATLQDGVGNKIKIAVWEHPDLTPMADQDVTLSDTQPNSKYPGVSVKHDSYEAKSGPKAGQMVNTVELSINKSGVFQLLHRQAAPAPTAQTEAPAQGNRQRNGMQVGMALNNATKIILEGGLFGRYTDAATQMPKDLAVLASIYLRASDWLEAGNIVGGAKPEAKPPVVATDDFEQKAIDAAAKAVAQRKADDERLKNLKEDAGEVDCPF